MWLSGLRRWFAKPMREIFTGSNPVAPCSLRLMVRTVHFRCTNRGSNPLESVCWTYDRVVYGGSLENCYKLSYPGFESQYVLDFLKYKMVLNSAVECFSYKEKVSGSNPLVPNILKFILLFI